MEEGLLEDGGLAGGLRTGELITWHPVSLQATPRTRPRKQAWGRKQTTPLFKQGTIDSRQFPRTPYGTETLENKFKFPKLWVILMMISGLQKTESRFQASGCRMKTARSRIKTLVSQSLKSCSRVKSLGISESWKPGPCLLVQPLKYTMQFFGFLGEFFLVFVFLFGCTRS